MKRLFTVGQLRHKLLLSYSLLYILSLTVGFGTFYFIIRENVESTIENELYRTTNSFNNLVHSSASVSIKNYLRGVAEKNLDIMATLYRSQLEGKLNRVEAQEKAATILLSQSIGQSGYIYCLDGNGVVVVHPSRNLIHKDVSEYSFVKDMIGKERGYLEYDWKNPEENNIRPKALYLIYFEPWDWFISVSSYRQEFRGLLNIDDFRDSIQDLQFGETGYAFIMDSKGTAIIHPTLEGKNILTLEGLPNEHLAYMLKEKTGQIAYTWKNPGETKARIKLCIFDYIDDYDWVVAATSYQDEFFEPLQKIKVGVMLTFAVTMCLVLFLTVKISESITSPLQSLMEYFGQASNGDFNIRMAVRSQDELGKLAIYFNKFMEQLEEYSSNLKNQIQVRKQAEDSLRVSEARYRLVMEAAADPIVIYDMDGKVSYFNPAFEHTFGWQLSECRGKKMDHFVPAENWPETLTMINAIKDGKILPATETNRFTKTGNIIDVSISGAAFKRADGLLAGSVVILRDVSETKRLTKQLMDIGDTIRQNIGQDLHDDLCPHLIGTGGMVSALKASIANNNSDGERLANTIIQLIDEATKKARILARGLCPVHLVSSGLQAALSEIAEKTTISSGIQCTFTGDQSLTFLDNTLATHLYYIVQEAVNNAVKHSGGSTIAISLIQDQEYIHLKIVDDGSGIQQNGSHSGIGLQIMQHRALVCNAFLEISDNREQENGTSIHVFMKKSASTGSPNEPLHQNADGDSL